MTPAERAEEVARSSYGRLLAVLAARTGDIPAAEDVLADAFERALRTWPTAGIPNNPEGWLVTVAKNRWLDAIKARRTTDETDEPVDDDIDMDRIPDKRLGLMFACAHPAIDPAVRTPLMLQVVLGFEASAIAAAFAMWARALPDEFSLSTECGHARVYTRIPQKCVTQTAGCEIQFRDRIASRHLKIYR